MPMYMKVCVNKIYVTTVFRLTLKNSRRVYSLENIPTKNQKIIMRIYKKLSIYFTLSLTPDVVLYHIQVCTHPKHVCAAMCSR